MSIIPFDPLTYARRLEDAGLLREQAEVHAHTLQEYMDKQTALMNELLEKHDASSRKDLATKSDLLKFGNDLQIDNQGVRTELKEDIQNVRSEVKEDIKNVRNEVQAVRKELHDVRIDLEKQIQGVQNEIKDVRIDLTSKIGEIKNSMIKWYLTSMVGFAGLMLGMFMFMMHFLAK